MLTKYLLGVEISEISIRLGFLVENDRTNIVDAASVGAICTLSVVEFKRLAATSRWSRGRVLAVRSINARKPTAGRAGMEAPTPSQL